MCGVNTTRWPDGRRSIARGTQMTDCPECGGEFEAILCRCGRGYTSLSDFGKVRERETGRDEYVCDCGSTLHYE